MTPRVPDFEYQSFHRSWISNAAEKKIQAGFHCRFCNQKRPLDAEYYALGTWRVPHFGERWWINRKMWHPDHLHLGRKKIQGFITANWPPFKRLLLVHERSRKRYIVFPKDSAGSIPIFTWSIWYTATWKRLDMDRSYERCLCKWMRTVICWDYPMSKKADQQPADDHCARPI